MIKEFNVEELKKDLEKDILTLKRKNKFISITYYFLIFIMIALDIYKVLIGKSSFTSLWPYPAGIAIGWCIATYIKKKFFR